ncbi:MAG: anthranilate synthase component I [Actinobacteria bacterium]|nr:anthranilate synthase component I [Actinomycetota bacterium]
MGALKPDRDTFLRLLEHHPVVPVWREVLADTQTPVAAFMRLDPSPNAFLLESVEGGERWARYSFVGGDAFAIVRAREGRVSVEGDPPVRPEAGEAPLAYVRRLLEACKAPRFEGLPPLHGGAVGFLGYDCVRELERLPDVPDDDLGLPDLALLLTRTMVVFDHLLQKAFVITNVAKGRDTSTAYDDAAARCDEIVERLGSPLGVPAIELSDVVPPPAPSPVSDDEYARWVEASREYIFAGDIFQVVPSRRFEAELKVPAFDAYRVLRTLNPSPYMYFLRFGQSGDSPAFEIAGSSPEPLVRVTAGQIITRPIAGTRPRGRTEAEDVALASDLLADEKERAEHVMLVDLARNDVGRVARYGSVTVDELMIIERYSHVMHIVSNVTGELAEGRTAFDALAACFPAGTVSGAPKVRAMQIIDELEETKRGPYAGVVGYFDFSGDLDMCITIRTIVATAGKAYVQAGAGIVADSVPESEVSETRQKAEALMRAVEAANRLRAQPS